MPGLSPAGPVPYEHHEGDEGEGIGVLLGQEVLAGELKDLGACEILVLNRAVSFQGDKELLYKANLWLRTCISIIQPIEYFNAHNEDSLYNGVKAINLEKYFDINQTFAINSAINSEFFNHSQYVSLKSKDAIVDQFREKTGERPSIDTVNPDIKINIHIVNNKCTVSLDSSGNTLNKRGYRDTTGFAPMNEVLAAGLILLSGWDKKTDFIDPMCGSGTILIEAAMIANNIAPNTQRPSFGFQNWDDYDHTLWSKVKAEALAVQKDSETLFFGYDISEKTLQIATKNILNAGLNSKIKLKQADVRQLKSPVSEGVVITNPPYGERLQMDNIEEFYKELGDTLKKGFQNHDAWLISSNKDALKNIGLRTSRKMTLINGSLECKFHKYEMYRGSKKNVG